MTVSISTYRCHADRRAWAVEDAFNGGDVRAVTALFTEDCEWRVGRDTPTGRREIFDHLTLQAMDRFGHRVLFEPRAHRHDRSDLGVACEWYDETGTWFRASGGESWDFDGSGLIQRRIARLAVTAIPEAGRRLRWAFGVRPRDHPGLAVLAL